MRQIRKRRVRSRVDDKIIDGYFPFAFPGVLVAEEVKALVGTMRVTVEKLVIQLLPKAAERAIVPMSGYKIGAISRGVSGNLYFGANIEFKGEALNTTVHAEQTSIALALSHGEKGLRAMTINAPPCGHCRQFMNEINTADELTIQTSNQSIIPFKTLLPDDFGPQHLNIECRLMDGQLQSLVLEKQSDDPIIAKALTAANMSYAPYSLCHAGMAIETQNGEVYMGIYAENAAYNPSLQPLQAAIANMIMTGKTYGDIKKAVLVQKREANIDLSKSTHQLLKSISNIPLIVEYAE